MGAAVDSQFSRPAIYALLDPVTGAVRYIGKSTNPRSRYTAHVERARKGVDTHQYRWMRSLLRRRRFPIMVILQSTDDLDEAERFWIRYHRERGADLTNITDGGTGGRTRPHQNCEHGDYRTDPLISAPVKGTPYFRCRLCRLNKLRVKWGVPAWTYEEYKLQRETGTKIPCRRIKPPTPRPSPPNRREPHPCIICGNPVPERPDRPGINSNRKTCSRACYLVRQSQWSSPNKGTARTHPCSICATPCLAKRKTCSPACRSEQLSRNATLQHATGRFGK